MRSPPTLTPPKKKNLERALGRSAHHQRGQFNAHPRFQNEESTEKESM